MLAPHALYTARGLPHLPSTDSAKSRFQFLLCHGLKWWISIATYTNKALNAQTKCSRCRLLLISSRPDFGLRSVRSNGSVSCSKEIRRNINLRNRCAENVTKWSVKFSRGALVIWSLRSNAARTHARALLMLAQTSRLICKRDGSLTWGKRMGETERGSEVIKRESARQIFLIEIGC